MGKLLNGGEGQNKRGVRELGTKYKREETKIGLSLNTLLTSLNIGISSILWSRLLLVCVKLKISTITKSVIKFGLTL